MSGVAGLYRLTGGDVAEAELGSMLAVQAHRGAYAHQWQSGSVGLGQCMHAATSTVYAEDSGPLVVVADARIDNRVALWNELGAPGEAGTDEALILRAYARWGANCPKHLLGAFAFAVWDGRTRTLLCARDHLGVRPLCYHHSQHLVAFGSEIKALLTLSDVPTDLDEARIATFMERQVSDTEATIYAAIRRLPPAHTLTVTPHGVHLQRYWHMDPARELDLASDAAFEEAFRELFEEAVLCRRRGAASLGSSLSGGLDSSSITVIARRQAAQEGCDPPATFSLVFDAVPRSDERRYIDTVLAQGAVRPHFVPGDRIDPFEELDAMLWHMDEPFLGPNLYLHWELLREAQRAGVDVQLEGLLGDSVVYHGDDYLTELASRGRWIEFAREAVPAAHTMGGGWRGAQRVLHRYVVTPLVADPLRHITKPLFGRRVTGASANSLLDLDFVRHLWSSGQVEPPQDGGRPWPLPTRAAHYEELTSGLLQTFLELIDRVAAASGLEVRCPFADRRLVEFCLALPANQRLRQGRTRSILRRALRGSLPEPIRRRNTKGNLSYAFARNLQRSPVLGSIVYDRLPIAAAYLDTDAVRRTYDRFCQGNASATEHFSLWQVAVLVRWLEVHQAPSHGSARRDSPQLATSSLGS